MSHSESLPFSDHAHDEPHASPTQVCMRAISCDISSPSSLSRRLPLSADTLAEFVLQHANTFTGDQQR